MSKKEDLKKVYADYVDSYKQATAHSRRKYLETLRPGAIAPDDKPRFYSLEDKEAFRTICDKHREDAMNIFESEYKAINEKITEAPDADAVNTVQLLSLREEIESDEIAALLDKYGDNVQAYNAIIKIADDNGIKLEKHPITEKMERLKNLAGTVSNAISVVGAEQGRATDAFASWIGVSIDEVFGDE